ncbi:protein Hook homolog 2-like [Brienomyrus brachyistius]|uniref:protein Hook homolog 2-like n=1 Tax=Brienomyrus brachyistius TaxID=42636 RepID=UPI0020B2250E|nr:protein Hook homolog 2-like [Brienomyrus brachyistius]
MSLDKADLCDSLLNWLQTFQVPSCSSMQDLTSGVAIAQVLHKIDPFWFNEAWLGRIKEESATNWRLKVSNLKKILQSILEYYHDVLGHPVSDDHLPDVVLIGEMGNVTELGKLVQLVLGCAVSCEKKQEHIQQIMTLKESVQHVVMTAIQELLTKDASEPGSPERYPDFDYQSRKYYFLSEDAEDDLNQRCRDLEHQLSVVLEEKTALQAEVRLMREQLSHSAPLYGPDEPNSVSGRKLLLLQSQMEQLREENFRLENSREEMRARGDLLERELQDVQRRNEELARLAQEAQSLKDEMDVLRHSSDRAGRLEALVESYRRKLEDLGDLRRQVRLLEERNAAYMRRTCELEEEQRRSGAVRGQLDACRLQVQELQAKHSAEALKAEKWQFEFKTLQDKYESLLKERERLVSERDALRETSEELRCSQMQQTCLSQAGASLREPVGNLAAEMMPTEFRETLLRLQGENRQLRAQEEDYRQQLQELGALLEASRGSQGAIEEQDRLNQLRISELQSQLQQLQTALQAGERPSPHLTLLRNRLSEPLEKVHDTPSDLQKKREFDRLEPRVDASVVRKIDELQEMLRKKDEEVKRMERQYRRVTETAQAVTEIRNPKPPAVMVSPEPRTRNSQLPTKNQKIHGLEHDFQKVRPQYDQEERIIINAWYNMGMALHQKVASEWSGSTAQGQSFLAQQRQSTYSRRGLTSRLQARLEGEKPGKV